MMLFIDGSVNPQSKIGYGASLFVASFGQSIEALEDEVRIKCFENTSSTRLELETLLWALQEARKSDINKLVVYTDSQNIVGLPEKRIRLEQSSFKSKRGKPLENRELYQEFYRNLDFIDCKFVKISGHKPANNRNEIDRLFSLVDKASRKTLRGRPQEPPMEPGPNTTKDGEERR